MDVASSFRTEQMCHSQILIFTRLSKLFGRKQRGWEVERSDTQHYTLCFQLLTLYLQKGNTPLHACVKAGRAEILALLLSKQGVDVDAPNDVSFRPHCSAVVVWVVSRFTCRVCLSVRRLFLASTELAFFFFSFLLACLVMHVDVLVSFPLQ